MADRKSRPYRTIIETYDRTPKKQRKALRRRIWQHVIKQRLDVIWRQAERAVLELIASAREAISSSLSESRKRNNSERD